MVISGQIKKQVFLEHKAGLRVEKTPDNTNDLDDEEEEEGYEVEEEGSAGEGEEESGSGEF